MKFSKKMEYYRYNIPLCLIDLKEKSGVGVGVWLGHHPRKHMGRGCNSNLFLAVFRLNRHPLTTTQFCLLCLTNHYQNSKKNYTARHTGSLLKRPLVRVCKHGNLSNVETDEFYELCLVAGLINLLSSELLDEMGTKFQLQFVITCIDNIIQCRHSKYADFVKISSNVKLNTSREKKYYDRYWR